jgi:hypothetical protein
MAPPGRRDRAALVFAENPQRRRYVTPMAGLAAPS